MYLIQNQLINVLVVIVTVDPTNYDIPVTVSSINENATEIGSAGVIGDTFNRFLLNNYGNTVTIIAGRTGTVPVVSFSANGTNMIATLTQQVVGVSETSTQIAQTDWNLDKANGTGDLPNIDWSLGNVYQIRYQWLGYGSITFYIEEPTTGFYVPVHRIQYANTQQVPSLFQPTLQFLVNVANTFTQQDTQVFCGSVYGAIDGTSGNLFGNRRAITYRTPSNVTVQNGDLTCLFKLVVPPFYRNKSTQTEVFLTRIVLTCNEDVSIYLVRNAALEGNTTWVQSLNILTEYSSNTNILVEQNPSNLETISADRLIKASGSQARLLIEPLPNSNYITKICPGDTLNFVFVTDSSVGTSKLLYNISINLVEAT